MMMGRGLVSGMHVLTTRPLLPDGRLGQDGHAVLSCIEHSTIKWHDGRQVKLVFK